MNYKFTFKGFDIKMKGEGHIKLDEISVEVEDMNLKDVAGLIKEGRKIVKDIQAMVEEDRAVTALERMSGMHDIHLHPLAEAFFGDCDCEDEDGDDHEVDEDSLDTDSSMDDTSTEDREDYAPAKKAQGKGRPKTSTHE